MLLLNPGQRSSLKKWFLPEPTCWTVGMHVIQTGNGACFADRWPNPRAVLVDAAGNYALFGDPDALGPEDLAGRIAGMLSAPDRFAPLLKNTFPNLKMWQRVLFELPSAPRYSLPADQTIRRLVFTDAPHLWGLSPASAWISKTWGGPGGLASSGYGWGAFAEGRLVSVACTFYLGHQYEELGVVTEPAFRGRGLSAACVGALCEDIRARGRRPSWSTSPDNTASIRVAEKVGFALVRHDRLYVIGVSIPESPRRSDG